MRSKMKANQAVNAPFPAVSEAVIRGLMLLKSFFRPLTGLVKVFV